MSILLQYSNRYHLSYPRQKTAHEQCVILPENLKKSCIAIIVHVLLNVCTKL